ncbi:right-handed parallel beta-helix repeat-containing protein [Mycolicibacterium sphagni]|uniref:right-handed parallel beta-helix repeat-containing protein n=1 Tax=Mycolicibacterium sphagni TaxID=1786 RepID=UPI0021F36F8C|nr:right-handed parallel beta-helix repeat-containing protein [Mycolicibacterium sphagni]MCV7177484.1 right-handed parallel beta-helix repeat-containing protein [Mycolicibacterium sphagni]
MLTAAATLAVVERTTPRQVAATPNDLTIAEAITGPGTYYVSASGSDTADGRAPEAAWATIGKVNASVPASGSTILFRRDDTFYGELNLPAGCEVGAFGTGSKPILTMFKLLNRSTGWTEQSDDIWSINLGSPETHDGYTTSNDANIGYLSVDGEIKPVLKFDLSELSDPWDFYCDIPNHTLYVKASANPTTLAEDIKAAPNGNNFGVTGRVIYCPNGGNDIHDIHVTGSGGCGIGGTGPDVHIHDCLIDYIGGSWLAGHLDGKQRYGNGIENWVDVKRWLIENNEIAQVYDVAWSPQGIAGSTGGWEDMTVRNNHIHDCNQSFEFWSKGDKSAPGFQRILVEGNLCERAGYSVFSDVRPDQGVRVHLLTYPWETRADITIQNNVFDDAYGAYSYHYADPVGLVTRNNTIRLKPGHLMQLGLPQTVEEAADWQAATGQEVGSTITVL